MHLLRENHFCSEISCHGSLHLKFFIMQRNVVLELDREDSSKWTEGHSMLHPSHACMNASILLSYTSPRPSHHSNARPWSPSVGLFLFRPTNESSCLHTTWKRHESQLSTTYVSPSSLERRNSPPFDPVVVFSWTDQSTIAAFFHTRLASHVARAPRKQACFVRRRVEERSRTHQKAQKPCVATSTRDRGFRFLDGGEEREQEGSGTEATTCCVPSHVFRSDRSTWRES